MQKKISFLFNQAWLLKIRNEIDRPVDKMVKAVQDRFDVKVLSQGLTGCDIVITEDGDVSQKILEVIKTTFCIENTEDVVEYIISDYIPKGKKEEPKEKVAKQEAPQAQPTLQTPFSFESKPKAIEKIRALVGAAEFKKFAEECVKLAPVLIKHNTTKMFTSQCYLFNIDDGNGLTTYLNLFADLIEELGLFACKKDGRIVERRLYPNDENGKNPFEPILSRLGQYGGLKGEIICIDISEWMTDFKDAKFREFLSVLEDYAGDNIFVFRVPFVEKEVLHELKNCIGDRLFLRDISFTPFNSEELLQSAKQYVSSMNFVMEEDAWDIFEARIMEEKNDGRFYGINTVQKVVHEMLYLKQLCNAENGVDDNVVKKSEILGLAVSYDSSEKKGIDRLDDFIGMEAIKTKVSEIVAQIEMTIGNEKLDSPCIHMRFVGNPGTGKTTVARVLGQILKEKGILRKGNFFEHAARDLCGRYIGSTAPKTTAICRDAYGSVLFLDEAYSLHQGEVYSSADYGKEAIDTLIAQMENHRHDMVVIMAGYPKEMGNLMKVNPGLESRMPYIIEFPNYTKEQLEAIFMMMVNKKFRCAEGFADAVKQYFTNLPDEIVSAKEFSNARFVRNLYERTWAKAALRMQFENAKEMMLTKEDFTLASSEKEFALMAKKSNRTLGFI